MALIIKDLVFSKDKYLFGEDKEMNISFSIYSDDKEYKLNGVKINFGIRIFAVHELIFNDYKTIKVSDDVIVNPNNPVKIEFTIPILIPNIVGLGYSKIDYNNYYIQNIKNYFEVILDKRFNPFDKRFEFFPLIESKIDDNYLINTSSEPNITKYIDQTINEIINSLNNKFDVNSEIDDIVKVAEFGGSYEYELRHLELDDDLLYESLKLLKEDIDSYLKSFVYVKGLSLKEFFNNLKSIFNNFFDNCKKQSKLGRTTSEILKFEKGYEGEKETVRISKNFYDYLFHNSFLFRIKIFLSKGYNLKLVIFFISLAVYLSIFIKISHFLMYDYRGNNSDIYVFWLISILLFFVICTVFYFFILEFDKFIIWRLRSGFVKIKFNSSNFIRNKLANNNLSVSDIFKFVGVKNPGNYNFSLKVYLISFIKYNPHFGSGDTIYHNDFYLYKTLLGEYSGTSFDINNVSQFKNPMNLSNIYIPIRNFNLFRFTYKLTYEFSSSDLFDKSDELSL